MVLLAKSRVYPGRSKSRRDLCGLTQPVTHPDGSWYVRQEWSAISFFKCVLNTRRQNHLGQIPWPFPRFYTPGKEPKALLIPQTEGKKGPAGTVTGILGTSPQKDVQLFQHFKKIFKTNREHLRVLPGRRGTLPASSLNAGEWGQETLLPALHLSLGEGRGLEVSSITAKEQMPEHTLHSPQLENSVERILRVSFALGTHRSLLEQKSRGGYCWRGGERKQGRKRVRERTGIASGLLQPG